MHHHRFRGGAIRRLVLLVGVVAGSALIAPVAVGSAQADRISCGWFETQEDAQAALDSGRLPAAVGDPDGNGIACEDLPSGGAPPVRDRPSCGWFETQEDAQEAFAAGHLDPAVFDPDGDGVVCEMLPRETSGSPSTVRLPSTGSGPARGAMDPGPAMLLGGLALAGAGAAVRRRAASK